MNLVAFLGKDKENWGQVTALVNRTDAEKIFLIKSKGTESFQTNEKCKIIEVNSDLPLMELKREIGEKIKEELSSDLEVALSMASGSGKEHMALISALLAVPVGVKMVAYTKKGVEFIN